MNNKYTFTICVRRVWIVIGYFLLKKQTFNGLSKVIVIQKLLLFEKERVEEQTKNTKKYDKILPAVKPIYLRLGKAEVDVSDQDTIAYWEEKGRPFKPTLKYIFYHKIFFG